MHILAAIVGLGLIFIILVDAFETIVLPRRVTKRLRFARIFNTLTWMPWAAIARRIKSANRRENMLSYYGPFSLLLLIAVWVTLLVVGFGLLHYAVSSRLQTPEGESDLFLYIYMSGSSFFTLGLGDVAPLSPFGRFLVVTESGAGFAFLALIIGYLPALNTAFSQREVRVSMLDERAGSPPTAIELLRRHKEHEEAVGITQILHDWERWSAELLESHLSYPVLGYFRSQHDNQSWVASLTAILDTSALVIVGVDGVPTRQAQLTFAMARHAAADLSQIYRTPPRPPVPARLASDSLSLLRTTLEAGDVVLKKGEAADRQLENLRSMYEPYVAALSHHLIMALPPWIPPASVPDAWQTTAWGTSEEFHLG